MNATTCLAPAVGERLLDEARRAGAPLEGDLHRHLADCAYCQVALERARRVAETWHALGPSAADVARAHARFVARSRPRRYPHRLSVVLAIAALLVATMAFANVRTAVVALGHRLTAALQGGRDLVPRRAAPSTARGSAPVSPAPLSPPSPSASSSAAPSALPVPVAAVVESNRAAPSLATHPAATAPRSGPSPSSSAVPPTLPGTETSAWTTAAAALRSGDYPVAERAFDDLARAKDPKVRDEARLARAQLWIAEQRAGEARPQLESLAAKGATPLVRQRAADALRTLSGSSDSP